jgi:hypothetical protein
MFLTDERKRLPQTELRARTADRKARGVGWCSDCNRGIGNFRDDPALLAAAIAYLALHQGVPSPFS